MMRSLPTLQRYISFAIALVAVAPIIGVSVIVGGLATARIERDMGIRFQSLATRIADRLDEGLHERLSDMRSIAIMLGGDLSDEARSRLRTAVEAARESTPHYEWIGLADATGNVLVSTGGMLEGIDVSSRPWFRSALQGAFIGDVHDAVLLDKLLGPTADGTPRRFVDVAVPLRRDGITVGVLGGHLSWAWADMVENAVLGIAIQQGREALIVSVEGTVLLGPPDLLGQRLSLPIVQAGAQGSARTGVETWPDGQEYLTAVTRTRGFGDNPGLGWTIIVRQPSAEALATARAIRWQLAGVGLVGALLAFLTGLWLTRKATQPLVQIASAADRIRQGDLSVHVPYTRAYAEVASLSAVLVELKSQLSDGRALEAALNPDDNQPEGQNCGQGVFDPRLPPRPREQ